MHTQAELLNVEAVSFTHSLPVEPSGVSAECSEDDGGACVIPTFTFTLDSGSFRVTKFHHLPIVPFLPSRYPLCRESNPQTLRQHREY